VALSWVTYLWPSASRVLEGQPRVIIRKRDRLTLSEIESEMRLAGIASVQDVAWAILEPGGKISFIRQSDAVHMPAV